MKSKKQKDKIKKTARLVSSTACIAITIILTVSLIIGVVVPFLWHMQSWLEFGRVAAALIAATTFICAVSAAALVCGMIDRKLKEN